MGRSPSGKKQAGDGAIRLHDPVMVSNERTLVKDWAPQTPTTLRDVRGVVRIVLIVVGVAAALAGAVAAARAVLDRSSGGAEAAPRRRGSFDTWPAVPPARDRSDGNGSRAASQPGTR